MQSAKLVCSFPGDLSLLGAIETKKSDGSRRKGPVAVILHTPLVEQTVAEGAAQGAFFSLPACTHQLETFQLQ